MEPRRRVRAFVAGLLAELPGRTAGRSPSMPGKPARTACSICWPGRSGMPTPSATTSVAISWNISPIRTRCRWSTRRATGRRQRHRRGPAAVHRHHRPDRERPGHGLAHLRHHGWTWADRPGAVSTAALGRRPGPSRRRQRPGRRELRDQADAGPADDRPDAGGRRSGRVGERGRGLRRRPATARRAGASRPGLRPRRRSRPSGADRRRPDPRGHAHPATARPGLAAAFGRCRRERRPRLRLGPDRHSVQGGWTPLAAGPPAPPHRQTRLLPLVLAGAGAANHRCPRRRQPVDVEEDF